MSPEISQPAPIVSLLPPRYRMRVTRWAHFQVTSSRITLVRRPSKSNHESGVGTDPESGHGEILSREGARERPVHRLGICCKRQHQPSAVQARNFSPPVTSNF